MIYGFIGSGVMGSALARATAKALAKAVAQLTASGDTPDELWVSDVLPEKAAALSESLGPVIAEAAQEPSGRVKAVTNEELAASASVIFLAVKPQYMEGMLAGIRETLAAREDRFILVSMAAGLSIERIKELSGKDYPMVRIMPNTPAQIGQGVVIYTPDSIITEEEVEQVLFALRPAGKLVKLSEAQLDAGGCVSGCGPAFVDLFVEALSDGGVLCGLPRKEAMELSAQMVLGSAALILESGQHPGALKDAVTSPGGTTIEGVRALEAGGFRSAVMEAVIAAWEKNKKLG